MTAAVLAALLVSRLATMLVARRFGPTRDAAALGSYGATSLSLIVAITDIAVKNDAMTSLEAGPLIIAGMLSATLFPVVAVRLLGKRLNSLTRSLPDNDAL